MLDYLDVLARLHDTRRPHTYLEIGVFNGDSLRLAREDAVCVGVDPEPAVSSDEVRHCHIEATTSDRFFAGNRPRELFGDRPIDLVFIDGMHLFEYALRDFLNAEALAGPDSLVVLHDCLARDAVTSSRERTTDVWTGDIWKLVLCLLDHRPDLELSIIDIPPSGLCLISHLNPQDSTLGDGYERLVQEYLPLAFTDWQVRLPEVLERTTHTMEAEDWSVRARLVMTEAELAAVYKSTSWRITAPLRRVATLLKRLTG
jgi:predicted O-methyltransferase YrrM